MRNLKILSLRFPPSEAKEQQSIKSIDSPPVLNTYLSQAEELGMGPASFPSWVKAAKQAEAELGALAFLMASISVVVKVVDLLVR
jgi:hypothetical protein